MSAKKFVVLDTRHQVKTIREYLTHICQQQPLVGMVMPYREQALSLIQALVAEIMESKDQTKRNVETDWEVVYASIIFGLSPDQVLHRQVKFVKRIFKHDIIDSIYDDIRHQIEAHEKYSSYVSWEVINTGGLIGLAEIGDQRILAWEQLQNAQEEKYITLDLTRVFDEFQTEFTKNFGPYPASQLDAMLLTSVMNLFPQLNRVDRKQEEINYDMAAAYGIPDLTNWLHTYITKVLLSFNIPAFAQNIPVGIKYDFNYCAHKLVIREHVEELDVVDTDEELAKQLLRGDYLPREDREKAERYILENQ